MRYDFPKTKFGIIVPALYQVQGKASELNMGALLRYKISQGTKFTGFYSESAIAGGMLYRINDALIPQVFFELAYFSIGISYDINIASASQVSKPNAIEISLKYSNLKDALFKEK